MHRHPRHLVAALVCLCLTTPLFTACSAEGRKAAPSSPSPSTGGGKAALPSHCPSSVPNPIGQSLSTQVTADLDDDSYADVVESDEIAHSSGDFTFDKRIVWGGPDGSSDIIKLSDENVRATGVGDFDGDGALDLLTIAAPSFSESVEGPQPATVLYGPLSRDGGVPRTTQTFDVGYKGWASVFYTIVGDFDGDGRDDVVTKAEYGEEDARFEMDMPESVLDATFYRGTAKGLKPAGSAPGITSTAGSIPVAVGDFDGDGKQDIIADGQVDERTVAVYGSNEGPGRGRPRAGELGKLLLGSSVTVCDINGDGYDDIATQSRGNDRSNDQVVVLGGKDGLSAATAGR